MTRDKAKAAITRRDRTLKDLRRLLAAERRLNAALSDLAFLPVAQQDAEKIKELNRAMALKRKWQMA